MYILFYPERRTLRMDMPEAADPRSAYSEDGNASQISPQNVQIYEDETVEDLHLKGLRVIQKKKGFRFGMDAVLLADFANIHPQATVADFGSGTCILPLLLMGRSRGMTFHAFEIQPKMAEMAARTVQLNRLEDRIQVYCEDAGKAEQILHPCSMDAVICNPPYGRPGTTITNPDASKAVSRHQQEEGLDSMLVSAFRVLKGKGRLFLIYPASQMLFLFQALQKAHMEPKRFRLVYPCLSSPANLVLVEAVKDARPMLHPMPPLILYQSNGDLTSELKSVYHIQEQTEV